MFCITDVAGEGPEEDTGYWAGLSWVSTSYGQYSMSISQAEEIQLLTFQLSTDNRPG